MRIKINLSILALVLCGLSSNVYASEGKGNNQVNPESKKQAFHVNKDTIEGSWKELKGKIQKYWAKLTDDDVLKMKGTANELEGMLQQKYGYTKEEAEKSIQEFLEENKAYIMKDDKK